MRVSNNGKVVSKEVVRHVGQDMGLNLLLLEEGGERHNDPLMFHVIDECLRDRGGMDDIPSSEDISPGEDQIMVALESSFLLVVCYHYLFDLFMWLMTWNC